MNPVLEVLALGILLFFWGSLPDEFRIRQL